MHNETQENFVPKSGGKKRRNKTRTRGRSMRRTRSIKRSRSMRRSIKRSRSMRRSIKRSIRRSRRRH
jgi:hypothetical protein